MTDMKYHVPSMREIENIPHNGFYVASTFSGGGGSCLGYRMAGYKVLYANEFVEEAQNTYRLNHKAYLDTRDIRTITADDILEIIGKKQGELDLFDGSPPCCAFSTAGSREKGWGQERAYSDGKMQRIDDLFYEYVRLVNGIQPKVFVAENVSGLVKGVAKGYFKRIIEALIDCGYNVKASLVNAKYLGVPQSRERIIFQGVRKDLKMQPVFPKPSQNVIPLKDALEAVENDKSEIEERFREMEKYKIGTILKKIPKNPQKVVSGSSVMNGSWFNLIRESMYKPCSTICQMNGNFGISGNCHPLYDRKFTTAEVKRIMSIPDDFTLTGTIEQKWERLGRMVPPVMMMNISKVICEEILCKTK